MTPAGTVVARVADLRFRGEGAVLAGGPAPRPAPACAPSTPAGRQRHSERKQKARPKFAHTAATKQTSTGKPQVTVFAPGFY